MTEEVARASIDWLRSTTCRVLALMGGEVTLRPKFVHKIVYYIRDEDRPRVAEVLDWLIEKQKAGYPMTNSVERLAQMKD